MRYAVFCAIVATVVGLLDVRAAASASADQTVPYLDRIVALREDIRETRVVEKLDVNIGTNIRLISPDKCEKEGEFELHVLASRAYIEETYVLIPDLCLWIEVGYAEKRTGVRVDTRFIGDLLKQYDSLSFYHIQAGIFPHFENYFPAYKDLITLVLINSEFIRRPKLNVRHFIISRFGMTEYKLTSKKRAQKFLEYSKKVGLKGFEAQNLAYEYARDKYRDTYYSKVESCKSSAGSTLEKINNLYR